MSAPPPRILRAVELLQLRATDTVLEIGCGGGHALSLMAEVVTRGQLIGIDRSALQVKAARARNRAAILAGRVRVEQLSLEAASAALPERFDKIFAVNVNAFWTTPDRSFPSVTPLLRPAGRLHLLYELPSPTRARELATLLPDLLSAHSFVPTSHHLDGKLCAITAKRAKPRAR